MCGDRKSNGSEQENHDVGDRNVERLLAGAYHPEVPDPAFVEKATAAMHAAAAGGKRGKRGQDSFSAETVGSRTPPWRKKSPDPFFRLAIWAACASILIATGALLGIALFQAIRSHGPDDVTAWPTTETTREPDESEARPAMLMRGAEQDLTLSQAFADSRMIPRRRPDPTRAEQLGVGASAETDSRRRLELPDGSMLYLNAKTAVALTGPRELKLEQGEIYVDVAPTHDPEDPEWPRFKDRPFHIVTPDREITALGTKFNVRLTGAGTGLVVAQGKVEVSGVEEPILAGQQLVPQPGRAGAAEVSPAPRVSHVVDWTRDLVAKAESRLVPASTYSGGALTIKDPDGQESKLSLRKYHVDVHVDDGFARTTIDQTFFNHRTERLEGTFHFPLPPDASLSRLAMYVNGKLMEGGMAERGHARQVFESIVRKMKDPALLEWVDGSTFKMRVFPLEGRQEKRIVISYTQRLPSLYDRTQYRFPGGHNMQRVGKWSCRIRVKDGAKTRWKSDSHPFEASRAGGDLVLEASAERIKPDQDVLLTLHESDTAAEPQPRFCSANHEGARYLMLRWRPELAASEGHERRDWVFLFESSADRDPLLARVQVDVIKTFLENADRDDTFSILTAGTRVHALAEKPKRATPKNVRKAVEYLEKTHLIGALDLERAFAAAKPLIHAAENPYLVHVGSGLPVLGEREVDVLVKRVPKGARYVGVGVGKRWSRLLMKTAASRTGGYFTQINPDEEVSWRAFELFSTLSTPRLFNVHVVDNAERYTFLCHSDYLAEGEELCAIARMDGDDKLPKSVEVTGTLEGTPFSEKIAVRNVAQSADYLPRTWAKLEIDRMVAEGAGKNRSEIVRLSKSMYVMSPFTSLLVLENDAMYAQYNVDRGRKDHWALYPCPDKIPVVHEPLPSPPVAQAPAETDRGKPAGEEVLGTVLVRIPSPSVRSATSTITAHDLYLAGWRGAARRVWLRRDIERLIRATVEAQTWGAPPEQSSLLQVYELRAADAEAIVPLLQSALPDARLALDPKTRRLIALGTSAQQAAIRSVIGELESEKRPLSGDRRKLFMQMVTAEVVRTINQARGKMASDPEAALQDLKLQLENVRRVPELEADVRDQLVDQLQAIVRQAEHRSILLEQRRQENPELLAAARERQLINENLLYYRGTMEELMEQFNPLLDEGRYRMAEEVSAGEALGAYGFYPFVPATADYDHLLHALALRVARQKGIVDALYQVEKAHIPFPDEPPIIYPYAEVWKALTARRRELYSRPDLAGRAWAEWRIAEQLKAPAELYSVATPLREVIDTLEDSHGIPIEIDQQALDDVGIAADVPITRSVSGISLRSALRLMLRDLDLTYVIQDGVLQITTPEEAEMRLGGVRVYPVADLVIPVTPMGMEGMGMMGRMGAMGMGGMGGMDTWDMNMNGVMGMGGMGGMGMGGMGMGGMGGMFGMGGFGVPGSTRQILDVDKYRNLPVGLQAPGVFSADLDVPFASTVFSDGSVHFLPETIDYLTYQHLMTPYAVEDGKGLQARITGQLERTAQLEKRLVQLTDATTETVESSFETSDGRIRWVNERNGTVWINLGRADGLQRPTSFSVYPADANEVTKGGAKGTIRVTQILNDHLAEARIVDAGPGDPIAPGDLIHVEPALDYAGAPPNLDSRVIEVGPKGLVEIDMGSDDGLRKGHLLDVVRQGRGASGYVGRIELAEVEPDKAVCRILPDFLQRPVHKGDYVTTRPDLARYALIGDRNRISHDLLSYAPGLNTMLPDIQAVLETEIEPRTEPDLGKVDNRARRLIQKARSAGWRTATWLDDEGEPVLSIDFDGTGRLAYQRTTGGGLNESVISNGTHLWRLYAELGLGARRELSRFHRALLLRMIPWALPPVDDLARGADLRAVGKRTVAVAPRGAESAKDKDGKPIHYVAVRLVFGADDRLAERRMVQMPSGKLIVRQVLDPDGTVRWLDRRGEVTLERKCRLEACGAPDLEPNTEKLVVLPMPLRSREHLRRSLKAEGQIDYERVSEDVALALIASQLGTPEASEIIARRFLAPGDRRLGLYVLWLAGGVERAPEEEAEGPDEEEARAAEAEDVALRFDPLGDHPDEPLAKYLAGYVESRQGDDWSEIGLIGGPSEGFVQQLAWFHDLRVRWASAGELDDSAEAQKKHEQLAQRTIDFIRRSTSRARAWAMFTLLLDEVEPADPRRQLAALAAEIARSFEDVPGVSYKARYEHARLLAQAGEHDQARQLIAGLYDDGLQLGVMLPVDGGFREVFFDEAEEPWQEFVGNLSTEVISRGGRRAAIRLARALHQMEEAELAEEVFSQAVAAGPQPMPWATTLDAVEYLCGAGKHARADAVLDRLVTRKPYSDVPALWRLAAAIAEKRGMTARSLACRERAMELEYDELPEMVELAPIRRQHGDLLDRYQELAKATGALGAEACQPLIAQVVRTADRWRSLDVDPDGACQKAARILTDLGATDLAWDYLTTAVAGDPEEAIPWNDLAETFRQEGRYGLADRSYAWASAGDPANPGILWNRAQALLESGRSNDAEPLLRELADGDWADEHEPLKSRAKEYLDP